MITMYRVRSGKDRVDSNLWFDTANQREGATSTRQVRGHLNVDIPQPGRLLMRRSQFSQRVASGWNSLPDWMKQAQTVDNFKKNLDKYWYPELSKVAQPRKNS